MVSTIINFADATLEEIYAEYQQKYTFDDPKITMVTLPVEASNLLKSELTEHPALFLNNLDYSLGSEDAFSLESGELEFEMASFMLSWAGYDCPARSEADANRWLMSMMSRPVFYLYNVDTKANTPITQVEALEIMQEVITNNQ